MPSGMKLTLSLLVLTLPVIGTAPVLADEAKVPSEIAIIASGTGVDENAALKQAFENAIMQAIGTIVDAETVVKNEQIITDQVLTASNAIITHYDLIGAPKASGGVVTVKIKATVLRKQLTARLAAANVTSKPVEGKDLFAQAVTDLQREKDAAAIIRRGRGKSRCK